MKVRAHDLFTMMALHKVFEIYESVEEALASLADWQPDTRPLPSEPDPREALLELACQTPES